MNETSVSVRELGQHGNRASMVSRRSSETHDGSPASLASDLCPMPFSNFVVNSGAKRGAKGSPSDLTSWTPLTSCTGLFVLEKVNLCILSCMTVN